MRKSLIITGFMLLSVTMFNSCGGSSSRDKSGKTEEARVQYTCPMHPEVVADAPGKCPKCHMDLVEKK